jgi:hypothetical protein
MNCHTYTVYNSAKCLSQGGIEILNMDREMYFLTAEIEWSTSDHKHK